MPGNEVGDRVHNFFAQDNLPQGQHHSQVAEGSWPVVNNNFWAGSQKQITSSSPRNYNTQSDPERGHSSHPLHVSHGLNFTQTTQRPEFAKSQSHNQQPNLNGYMYGRQNFQARQDEPNVMGVDTESDRHNVNSRGLSMYESQQGGVSEHARNSVRSDTSDTPVSFDLFGGQQQMSSQHPSLLQGLPQQQLQPQLMFRKMQELQRQKEFQQLDARQQNSVNQMPSFARQPSSGLPSTLINGSPIPDASYPWGELTVGNSNWMQRGSPSMQGTSGGLGFSPEQGQPSRTMGFDHQQADQSLYGVPVSSPRGNLNQYPHHATDKTSIQQMSEYNNSFPGNNYAAFPEQVTTQDGTLVGRQGVQGKSLLTHASGQSASRGMNTNHLQQLNPLQRNASGQEFQGPRDLIGPSEILQDKTGMTAVSTQTAASLNPTEEKILFGSDDNIWEAFGGSTDMGGAASNLLDGNSFLNGLPSMQSGSWSALMQSAVAETSSSDVGLQEELAGLSFRNPDLAIGVHQPSVYNGTEKRQTALAGNDLQTPSAVSFGSAHADGANINNNYRSAMGFQQYGQKNSYEHGEGLSSERLNPPSSGRGKWFNCEAVQSPHAEGGQVYENVSRPLDGGMDGKSSVHWTSQQHGPGQLSSKPNSWSAIESVPPCGDTEQRFNKVDHRLQHAQVSDRKRLSNEETGNGDSIRKLNSAPNATKEPLVFPLGSPHMIREGFALNNAAALPNSSAGAQVGKDISQLVPNNHPFNYWKHATSSVKSKGTEFSGNVQSHLNKGLQVSESSWNSSDKEELKSHEIQSDSRKENSSDSYRSNLSHRVTAGGLRENVVSDAGDSRSLPGVKQKSSNQVGHKTPGPRKFQYHPMGDLDEDVEPSYETRHGSHLQARPQQHSSGLKGQDQGYFGQPKLLGQVPKSSGTGKGHILDQRGETRGYDEARSRGVFPGYMPNMFASMDKSAGSSAPNKSSSSQPSQNMLELLHKVDQSREYGTMKHLNTSEPNQPSEIPDAENADVSVGRLQRSQSSNSQGFGLQLAPPLQRFSVPNHASPSVVPAVYSNSSAQASSDREKRHPELSSPYSVQSLPTSEETFREEFNNEKAGNLGKTDSEASGQKMPGHFSSALGSGFPNSRSQLQNQSLIGARGQVFMNHSDKTSFDRHASDFRHTDESCGRVLTGQPAEGYLPNSVGHGQHDNSVSFDTTRTINTGNPYERVQPPQPFPGEKLPGSQTGPPFGASQPGASSKTVSNLWTNVPAQQHSLATQAHKFHANLSQSHQLNIVESASSDWQDLDNQDLMTRGDFPSELGPNSVNSQGFVCVDEQATKGSPSQNVSSGSIDPVHKFNEPPGKESLIKNLSDTSPVYPASTQRDLEAFGRSLKPNNLHQSYSLLNQMRAMKDSESDSSLRGTKRLKGLDNFLGGQEGASRTGQPNEQNAMAGDVTARRAMGSTVDSKMLSFAGPVDNVEKSTSSQLGSIPSKDMLAIRQNESQNYAHGNTFASIKGEHSQINPQMAPSWFNQYGTFKNGQILPIYDMRKAAIVKPVEPPFSHGSAFGNLETDNSKEVENGASDTSQVGVILQNSVLPSVTSEQFSSPLNMNVGSQNFMVLRPKKRKILHPWHKEVSQVSQNRHTFRTAADEWAKSANRLTEKVEDINEMIDDVSPITRPKKRLILTTHLMQQLLRPPPATILSADVTTHYESVSYFVARLALGDACSLVSCAHSCSDVPHGESNSSKPFERIDDHLSEVTKDLLGRARKLENDFLRLDKRASILDLRLECQDLEKFSVINRFAMFHGRGQSDGAESSSSVAAVSAQKSFPQRYVTAVPLPKNLPDRVQCLSL